MTLDEAIAPLARAIAAAIAAELKPLLVDRRDDDLVDRETAGVSKRWWDERKGKAFPVCKDGRRYVAKRSDVMAALERERRFMPKEQASKVVDDDAAELEAAGIHLGGRAR